MHATDFLLAQHNYFGKIDFTFKYCACIHSTSSILDMFMCISRSWIMATVSISRRICDTVTRPCSPER